MRQMGKLCEALPDFPKGVGCDQAIMIFMHPNFYPRVKIDYQGQLASRYFFRLSFAGQSESSIFTMLRDEFIKVFQ